MTAIEKETEKYISDVSSRLLCSKKKKKEIIEDIRGAVLDFTEANGTEDIKEVYEHFGTPEEFAKAHLSELDPVQIKKKVNIRRVVIVALTIAITMFIIALAIELIDAHRTGMGYYSEEIVTNKSIIETTNTNKNMGVD